MMEILNVIGALLLAAAFLAIPVLVIRHGFNALAWILLKINDAIFKRP